MGSYTTRELERDTGFGRRTIAYYVQEGLLPRVGRRGPRTRYPELVRDRLLFIRRVREAEAEAEIAPVRLSDLRELFLHAPRQLIASVAAGETPVTSDIVSPMSAERRSMVDRVSALRERLLVARPEPDLEPRSAILREGDRMVLRAEAPRAPEGRRAEESRARQELEFQGDALPAMEEDEVGLASDAESRYWSPGERDEDADALGNELAWVLRELHLRGRHRHEFSPEAVDTWSQVEVTPDIRLSVRGMGDEDAFLLRSAARLLRQTLELEPGSVERSAREREE